MFTQGKSWLLCPCPGPAMSSSHQRQFYCRFIKTVRNPSPFVKWSLFSCVAVYTIPILSLTLSRCLSEWDNKANWIDSREMWNFNTNRAGPVTRHRSRGRDQRNKLNIYICRSPGVHPVYSSDWTDHSISPIAGLLCPGCPELLTTESHPGLVARLWSGAGNMAMNVLMNWFVCPEFYDYLSPDRIKSSPWLGLLKRSRGALS